MTKLYVICGHGAGDPGACGCGYSEAERVRALGKKMSEVGGSQVELLDTSRNWYADGGINGLSIGSDPLIELHLDAASSSSAKGGHVIISSQFSADAWDKALASWVSGYFPGRAANIVQRSDLANPNRAAAKGINYRLLEVCFVSNASDMERFSNNLEDVARGILGCFGIGEGSQGAAEPEPTPAPAAKGKPTYKVHYALHKLGGDWWPEVIDWHGDDDADGYAGCPNTKHDMLLAYVTKDGKKIPALLRYRVHTVAGSWLPWVCNGDYNDDVSGMAGNWGQAIDGVQFYFETPAGEEYQQAWYRSQTTQRSGWLDIVRDDADYAGYFGEPLDRLQVKVGTGF